MIELMIERWISAGGSTDYVWSLWNQGSRLQIGNKHATSEAAETEARSYCLRALGGEPDRITRL